MRILEVLKGMGGAARRRDLLAAGVSRGEIHRALETDAIRRPFRGCLTLPHVSADRALACYFNARVTCLSAAMAHGIRVLDQPQLPHLEVHGDRAGHRDASLPHELVRMHRSHSHRPGALHVPVARAIDVAGDCVTPLAQLMMVDHALAMGRLTRAQISAFTVTTPPVCRWLAQEADPKSGSVSETSARIALREAGLHVDTQARFGTGQFADFLVNGCLYVEVDGYEYHSDRKQFVEDRARDRYLMGRGYRVVRFPYETAIHYPQQLVTDVMRVLSAQVKTA